MHSGANFDHLDFRFKIQRILVFRYGKSACFPFEYRGYAFGECYALLATTHIEDRFLYNQARACFFMILRHNLNDSENYTPIFE